MLPTFAAENQSIGNMVHTLVISDGWSGISSFIEPENPMVIDIFSELTSDDNLVILQNLNSVFWPDANLNSIDQNGGWDSKSGYMVKVDGDQEIAIAGTPVANKTLTFSEAGWYLIPVLSNCNVSVNELFENVLENLVIIKEVAGTGIYWPGVAQTLYSLQPGKSYFVKIDGPVSITYPECTANAQPASQSINK
jgi:hypothetical protein